MNPISYLNEMTQQAACPPPRYEEFRGNMAFNCLVVLELPGKGRITASGGGSSKKIAKHNAAQAAVEKIESGGSRPSSPTDRVPHVPATPRDPDGPKIIGFGEAFKGFGDDSGLRSARANLTAILEDGPRGRASSGETPDDPASEAQQGGAGQISIVGPNNAVKTFRIDQYARSFALAWFASEWAAHRAGPITVIGGGPEMRALLIQYVYLAEIPESAMIWREQ